MTRRAAVFCGVPTHSRQGPSVRRPTRPKAFVEAEGYETFR